MVDVDPLPYMSARPSDEGWKRVDVCILYEDCLYSTQCKSKEYRELVELIYNGSHPGDIGPDTFKVVTLSLIVEVEHVSDEESVKFFHLSEDDKRIKHVVYAESSSMAALLAERIALDAGLPQPPEQKTQSTLTTLANSLFISGAVLLCLGLFLYVAVDPKFNAQKEQQPKKKIIIMIAKKIGPVWISAMLGLTIIISTAYCYRRHKRRPIIDTYRLAEGKPDDRELKL